MFFCFEFSLLDAKEMKALQGPADRMKEEFNKQAS